MKMRIMKVMVMTMKILVIINIQPNIEPTTSSMG